MRLILGLLPLVVFYALEETVGLRAAVVAGIVLALVEVTWTRLAEGRWSRMTLATGALVVGLGGLALLDDDPTFVLATPAIGDLLLAAALVGFRLKGTNLVLLAAEEQEPDLDVHPLQRRFLDGLVLRLAANLVAHAALTAWAAGVSREAWLLVTGPGQLGMLGVQVAAEVAWARLVVLPRVEAAEAAALADRDDRT